MTRSLLTPADLGRKGFLEMLDRAAALKEAKRTGTERPALTGRNIALVFQKDSTRTRCAFEVAAHDQGAHVTYLGPSGSHLGREESVADTARVLGSMFDGIEFRGFGQETVEELARHAGVPVWNGLTDEWHPTQMLADVLTMREHHSGEIGSISFCFTGDGRSNIARSLLITGAMLGVDVRIAAPAELSPPEPLVQEAQCLAAATGARVRITDDPATALDGAAFVYTDVWVSMGEPDAEWDRRVPLLTPYRVTAETMAATGRPDTRFLHCLPAVHDTTTELGRRIHRRYGLAGAEVADEVFTSAASVVFQQAENRLHTIKAVLVAALGE
ncbi:ornithine carbamoyltransferase [Nonomuraea sp. WAC 01424]|uniref:ornithine carbamoyltransferase n=1 Tax=Nonomuraea sp. WAC 01424 TaxID=2203200 RepID=UPI000F77AF6F|nr:ornithine carbamoyltransferase [Nonomuraea sp. WAC 01424]RSM93705.1 ornithine carbamoyltransferase [Nonomuraea sp. WAC 01424]